MKSGELSSSFENRSSTFFSKLKYEEINVCCPSVALFTHLRFFFLYFQTKELGQAFSAFFQDWLNYFVFQLFLKVRSGFPWYVCSSLGTVFKSVKYWGNYFFNLCLHLLNLKKNLSLISEYVKLWMLFL